jgi:hypothetical protein
VASTVAWVGGLPMRARWVILGGASAGIAVAIAGNPGG